MLEQRLRKASIASAVWRRICERMTAHVRSRGGCTQSNWDLLGSSEYGLQAENAGLELEKGIAGASSNRKFGDAGLVDGRRGEIELRVRILARDAVGGLVEMVMRQELASFFLMWYRRASGRPGHPQ